MKRPLSNTLLIQKVYFWVLAAHVFLGMLVLPAAIYAQSTTTNYNTPMYNTAVQGQSSATVEGAVNVAVSYIGNIICPLIAGGFIIHAVIAWRTGNRPMMSIMTAGGMLCISGLLRLIEMFFIQGANGVTN